LEIAGLQLDNVIVEERSWRTITSPARIDPFHTKMSACAPCKGVDLQWVQIPPGNCRSSR